jgi:hypothetical protein
VSCSELGYTRSLDVKSDGIEAFTEFNRQRQTDITQTYHTQFAIPETETRHTIPMCNVQQVLRMP